MGQRKQQGEIRTIGDVNYQAKLLVYATEPH